MTRCTSPQCMYLSICVVSAKLEREEITNPQHHFQPCCHHYLPTINEVPAGCHALIPLL